MTAGATLGPRENDIGFARDLAIQARVAVKKVDNLFTIEQYGKPIFSSSSVRGIVRQLRVMLADV